MPRFEIKFLYPEQLKPLEKVSIPPVDEETRERMRESIKENGIHDPLHVVPDKEHPKKYFWVLSGMTRLEIAKEIGLDSVPCIIRNIPEEHWGFFAIHDNVDRRQMTKETRDAMVKILRENGMSYSSIGKELGISVPTVVSAVKRTKAKDPHHVLTEDGRRTTPRKSPETRLRQKVTSALKMKGIDTTKMSHEDKAAKIAEYMDPEEWDKANTKKREKLVETFIKGLRKRHEKAAKEPAKEPVKEELADPEWQGVMEKVFGERCGEELRKMVAAIGFDKAQVTAEAALDTVFLSLNS